MDDDDTPQLKWPWAWWIALIVSAGLWVLIWYGVGAVLYFIFSLK